MQNYEIYFKPKLHNLFCFFQNLEILYSSSGGQAVVMPSHYNVSLITFHYMPSHGE